MSSDFSSNITDRFGALRCWLGNKMGIQSVYKFCTSAPPNSNRTGLIMHSLTTSIILSLYIVGSRAEFCRYNVDRFNQRFAVSWRYIPVKRCHLDPTVFFSDLVRISDI